MMSQIICNDCGEVIADTVGSVADARELAAKHSGVQRWVTWRETRTDLCGVCKTHPKKNPPKEQRNSYLQIQTMTTQPPSPHTHSMKLPLGNGQLEIHYCGPLDSALQDQLENGQTVSIQQVWDFFIDSLAAKIEHANSID